MPSEDDYPEWHCDQCGQDCCECVSAAEPAAPAARAVEMTDAFAFALVQVAIEGHRTFTGRTPERINVAPDLMRALVAVAKERCVFPCEPGPFTLAGIPVVSSWPVLDTDCALGWP